MKTLIVTTCKDALWFPALPPDIGRAAIPWEAEQICREYGRLVLIGDLPEESYFSVPFLMHPRACVFLWDVVSNPTSPNPETLERLKPYYPVYSFDPADCEAYGLRPAPTCYWPRALPAPRETTGVLFVGREHGRAQALRALGRLCAGEGVPANIHVFGPEGGAPGFVPYTRYLGLLAGARAVADITAPGQAGFTQRVPEALFYGKKLITDNAAVLGADFYSPQNVFLLGQDGGLAAWMDTAPVPVSEGILEQYRFDRWAEARFAAQSSE